MASDAETNAGAGEIARLKAELAQVRRRNDDLTAQLGVKTGGSTSPPIGIFVLGLIVGMVFAYVTSLFVWLISSDGLHLHMF